MVQDYAHNEMGERKEEERGRAKEKKAAEVESKQLLGAFLQRENGGSRLTTQRRVMRLREKDRIRSWAEIGEERRWREREETGCWLARILNRIEWMGRGQNWNGSDKLTRSISVNSSSWIVPFAPPIFSLTYWKTEALGDGKRQMAWGGRSGKRMTEWGWR